VKTITELYACSAYKFLKKLDSRFSDQRRNFDHCVSEYKGGYFLVKSDTHRHQRALRRKIYEI